MEMKKVFSIESILQKSSSVDTVDTDADTTRLVRPHPLFNAPQRLDKDSDNRQFVQFHPFQHNHLYPATYHHHHLHTNTLAYNLFSHKTQLVAIQQTAVTGGNKCGSGRKVRKAGIDRKPRQAYSSKQLEQLEAEFKLDKYLSVSKRMELSHALSLTEVQIKTWFQNRRTKWKKQMTARMKMAQRQGMWCPPSASNSSSNGAGFYHGSSTPMYQTYLNPQQQQQPSCLHLTDPSTISLLHHSPSINYFLHNNQNNNKTK